MHSFIRRRATPRAPQRARSKPRPGRRPRAGSPPAATTPADPAPFRSRRPPRSLKRSHSSKVFLPDPRARRSRDDVHEHHTHRWILLSRAMWSLRSSLDHRMRAAARVLVVAEVDEDMTFQPFAAKDKLGLGAQRSAAVQASYQGRCCFSGWGRSQRLDLSTHSHFSSIAQRGCDSGLFHSEKTDDAGLGGFLHPLQHALRDLGGGRLRDENDFRRAKSSSRASIAASVPTLPMRS